MFTVVVSFVDILCFYVCAREVYVTDWLGDVVLAFAVGFVRLQIGEFDDVAKIYLCVA